MTIHRDDSGISTLRARSPHPPDTPVIDVNNETKAIELRDIQKSEDDVSKLEESVPSSTAAASILHADARTSRRKTNIHFAAMCWSLFMAGWNDGTTGPLLPRIQEVYHVRFGALLNAMLQVSHCMYEG